MRREEGFTYIELIVATVILVIIAAAAIPVAEVTSKRVKEIELRRNLRIMRDAIDNYKKRGKTNIPDVKNSLIPVTTVLGPLMAAWLTGSFIIEHVFSIPGIGRFFVSSINDRDYTLIMGTMLVYAVLLVFMNILVDISYAYVDPQIRYQRI